MAVLSIVGIGVEIARNLASKGSNLVINYTSDSSTQIAQDLASELEAEYGITAVSVQASMGSETGPKHLVEIVKNKFAHPKTGKFQLDIIINNAGVAGNNLVENVDCDDFARQFNINVRGPLLLIQAASPYLPNDRSGRIVNLSSVSSSLGFKGQSIYGGTKAALESMTRTWARELAERCTVNAINPGPVATDMYWSNDEAFTAAIKPFIEVRSAPLQCAEMCPRRTLTGSAEHSPRDPEKGHRSREDLRGVAKRWWSASIQPRNRGRRRYAMSSRGRVDDR